MEVKEGWMDEDEGGERKKRDNVEGERENMLLNIDPMCVHSDLWTNKI